MPTATIWLTALSSTTRTRPRWPAGPAGPVEDSDAGPVAGLRCAVAEPTAAGAEAAIVARLSNRLEAKTGLVRARSIPASVRVAALRSIDELSRMIRVSANRPSPRTIRANCSPLTPGMR